MTQWTAWAARRPPASVVHFDSAAAGRQSQATLDAVTAHARLEAQTGAYVAQEAAGAVLDRLRADLGGVFGVPSDGVVFVESATAALLALLNCWPLPRPGRVGIVPAEWGPNLEILARHGLVPIRLAVDGAGRLDLEALGERLRADPPDLVHLTQVTSHRALVQPVADAARLCAHAGVPLWVDAAQAVGHVDVACGADALYATGRKWLAGPRGVGMVAIAERDWGRLDVLRPAMMGDDLPAPRYLESYEAHVPGRVGFATAVAEYLADGPATVAARLDEVGRTTRAVLAEVPGWALAGPADAAGAITALRPLAGQDVVETRTRLLTQHGMLTTAAGTARAPHDMPEPLLRISPHVDCDPEELAKLASALA